MATDPYQDYMDAAVRALGATSGVVWATERDGGIVVGAKPNNRVAETVGKFNLTIDRDWECDHAHGVNYRIAV